MGDFPFSEQVGVKRHLQEDEADAKRPRLEQGDDGLQGLWAAAQAVQADLLQMDAEMTREFVRIERETAVKKRPLLTERGNLLRQVESFWCMTLCNSDLEGHISSYDKELLVHLDSLDVTSPDEAGSYSIHLVFSDQNPIIASPAIVRTLEKGSEEGCVRATCSEVAWKVDLREERDDDGKPLLDQYTFLTWFLSEGEFEGVGDPVAEEIRTAIWPNPIHFFTGGDMECDMEVQDDEDDDEANVVEVEDDAADDAAPDEADGDLASLALSDDDFTEEPLDEEDNDEGADGTALPDTGGGDDDDDEEDDEEEDDPDDADAL